MESQASSRRDQKPQLVSCPGCMAVTSLLALTPLIDNNLIDTDHLVVDSKIGSSGAGKRLMQGRIMRCVMA